MAMNSDVRAAVELAMEEGNATVISIVKYVRELIGLGLHEAMDYVCYTLSKMGHENIVKAYRDVHRENMRLIRLGNINHD